MIFIVVQNLVGIGVRVLKICEFLLLSKFAYSRPVLGCFGGKIGEKGNVLLFCPSNNATAWE